MAMEFASFSQEITERIGNIIEKFDIPEGEIGNIEVIGNGRINRTYNVTVKHVEGKKKYILQQVNTSIFKDPLSLMRNVVMVTEHITNKGHKTLHMHRLKNNVLNSEYGYYLLYEDNNDACWRLCDYIDSDVKNEVEDLEDLFNLGKAIGEFSLYVEDFDANELMETIPDFHNTPARLNRYVELMNDAFSSYITAKRWETCKDESAFIVKRISNAGKIINALEFGVIPMRVSHNDPKLNNVLFDKDTKEVMCLIDLDTIMPGSVLYDFGDACRFSCNEQSEETKHIEKVSFNLERYEKLVEGFLTSMKDTISMWEVRLMSYSAWLMTYELAVRFLDDHARGNVYFGINKDGDNLHRARVQMALLKDIDKKLPEMDAIVFRIADKLGIYH